MAIALELSGWLFGGGEGKTPRRWARAGEDGSLRGNTTAAVSDEAEAAIVEAVRRGDVAVFEQVYRFHARALTISAEGYLGSLAAAEDVVADVFANVWRLRAMWAPQRSIKAYLFGAVRNAALGQLRHAGVERRGELVSAEDEPLAMGQAPVSPDANLDLDARMAAVERVLAGFPEARRQVVYLRWQQGMSAEEIAAVMGTTRNAVDLQVSRALKALRALLPDWVGE